MAYTTVITHATGDVLPATDWNTYIRDNFAFLHDRGADLASAATLPTPTNQYHRVTGTTTITAIPSPTGSGQGGNLLALEFVSAGCQITASGALVLAGGQFTSFANQILVLVWDDLASAWIEVTRSGTTVGVVRREQTLIDLVSSTTETDLIGAQGSGWTIPPGTFGATSKMLVEVEGDIVQGGGVGGTLRVYLGGTKFVEYVVSNLSSTRGSFFLEVAIRALGALNSENLRARLVIGNTATAPATGFGGLTDAAQNGQSASVVSSGPGGIDLSIGEALRITWQWTASSASNELRVRDALVSLL